MKKLTSAVFGLSLSLAVAGISFAQTPAPATSAPAKDNGSAMTTAPAKKHSTKKSHKKATESTATPVAPATSPSNK